MSELEDISQRVISVMEGIDGLSHLRVNELSSIPLGTLREGTYNLQGACRFRKGRWDRVAKGTAKGPREVRCIDIHPLLLTEEWSRYADHVLFHEYLHALLPALSHGPEFRALESLWPDSGAIAMKADFDRFIRERRSDILKWELSCPNCDYGYLRKKPLVGARCRKCKTNLENIER
jgi:predicted SprT family Zn-dependent metalloprotease